MIKTIQTTIERVQLKSRNYKEVTIDVTDSNTKETPSFFTPIVCLLNDIRLSAVTKEV